MIKLLLLILTMLISPAYADSDIGLYDDKISKDMSFVRFVNLVNIDINPKVNDHKFPVLNAHEVSPYYLLKKDKMEFIYGDKELIQDIDNGQFYTLIISDNPFFIKDKKNTDRTKAVIAFYNLSDRDNVSLKANNKIDIFSNVGRKSMDARDINSTKLSLQVMGDIEVIGEITDVILERNQHYSVFFDGHNTQFIQSKIKHDK